MPPRFSLLVKVFLYGYSQKEREQRKAHFSGSSRFLKFPCWWNMKRIPYNISGTAYSIILLIGNSWSQMEEAEASFDLLSNQSCKHLHCTFCWCYKQAWLFTIFDIISSCCWLFLENKSLSSFTHNLHKTLWQEYFLGWVTKLQTIGHNDTTRSIIIMEHTKSHTMEVTFWVSTFCK